MQPRDTPTVLWCGRFSGGEGRGSVARCWLDALQSIEADVVAYDTETFQFVDLDSPHALELSREGDVSLIRSIDAMQRVVVVFDDKPDRLPAMTVVGNARYVAYNVADSERLPEDWVQNLTAVDEVWADAESGLASLAAAGVPRFVLHTIPQCTVPDGESADRAAAEQIVSRIDGLLPHDFRGTDPAVIRHKPGGSLWDSMKIPSRISIATHGVNSRLAAFGSVPVYKVAEKRRAYEAASAARRAHNVSASSLERHKPLAQLGAAMNTSSRKPLKKLKALRDLNRLASGMPQGDPRLGTAIQEFWDSEHRQFEPTAEFMERRKAIWDRFGAIALSTRDAERLRRLRDLHRGERVFVMGNGPSLNDMDLERLADEYTFGVNRIGLLFDRVSWRSTFWTVTDWRVGPQLRETYDELDGIIKFVPYRFRGVLPDDETTYWYHSRRTGPSLADQFEIDITRGIPSRGTVLVTAIQQAFYLGFREIYLIGVDASYSIPDTVIQSGPDRFGTGIKLNLESTEDDDINHFDPRYFGAGAKWHDPNVEEMLRMFRVMRKGVEFHGGTIKNATSGGNLEVFDRVDFESLF